MKKHSLLLAAAFCVAAVSSQAQGFFNFSNFGSGSAGTVNAPVYETDGTTKLGAGYKADYYWGPAGTVDPNALQSGLGASSPSFAGGGVFFGGSQVINGVSGGTTVTLQVRAWRVSDGTTWANAAASGPGAHVGQGNLIQLQLADSTATPQPTPPNMVGLQSFNLTTGPEPATIALGLMGAGALFIRRRKA